MSAHARELVDRLCPAAEQALGLEIVEGACGTKEEAIAAVGKCLEGVCTPGFLGSRKVVWLRNVSFLSEEAPGRFEDVKAAVAELTAEIKRGLPEGQILVISSPKVDRRSSFYKTCQSLGALKEFLPPDKPYLMERQAKETAAAMMSAAGLRCPARALEMFIERTGTDTRQIHQEIEKLAAYLGQRTQVEPEDVLAIVSPAREAAYWDFAEAFGQRDAVAALRALRQLMFQKEEPVGLIISLENRARDLLLFRECLDRRWLRLEGGGDWQKAAWSPSPDADAALSDLSPDPRQMNPFRAGKLAMQASRFSPAELLRALEELVRAHERMVSSNVPPDLLLELTLVRLLGRA
jgi:DNA polymerase III subunit delta